MTQSIVVQVGQCGNQIGCRFWDLALREHAAVNVGGVFDEPISTYFRNVDGRQSPPRELPLGDGTGKIGALKARAVLIDMEEGVINSLLTGPMREVFDPMLKVSSVVLLPSPSAVEGHSFGPNPPTPHREPMPHMPHASSHRSYVGHFLHGARGV
eukprot:m.185893 g.185893  ORF g.185893 m.185893 type:complete len:155 (+) comp24748_c0_seq6:250-714(+)